jgi:hypothetical protein
LATQATDSSELSDKFIRGKVNIKLEKGGFYIRPFPFGKYIECLPTGINIKETIKSVGATSGRPLP